MKDRAQQQALEYARQMQNIGMNRKLGNLGLGAAAVMTEDERKRYTAKLDETRPLKGNFRSYITEVDVSSRCERLSVDYQDHLDRRWRNKMKCHDRYYLDVDGFRSWCEALDADQEWIEKTERELF